MASPAPAALPEGASIYVKVVQGKDLRNHLGKEPTVSMLLRVSVAGQVCAPSPPQLPPTHKLSTVECEPKPLPLTPES